MESLPAASLDTRPVGCRDGHRLGAPDAGRRHHRTIPRHDRRGSFRPRRHHRHRPGFQEPLLDHPQHHGAPLRGGKNGRRIFHQEGIPPLRLLRHARVRLVRRTLSGVPRHRKEDQSGIHLLGPQQHVAEQPLVLRPHPAHHLAPVAAQTGRRHGLRRQSGLPHHGSLPPSRGGGEIAASRTI